MTYWVSAIHVNQNKIEIKTNFSKSRLFCMKGNNEQVQPYFAKFNITKNFDVRKFAISKIFRLFTVCQKGVKNKTNCLSMTPVFFGRAYSLRHLKKAEKKIFGVQKFSLGICRRFCRNNHLILRNIIKAIIIA